MALGLTPQQIIDKNTHPLLIKNEDWKRVELEEIAEVQNGYAFSSKNFNHTEGLPLIRIRDIFSETTENLYNGDYPEEFLVRKDDILIGMDGDFKVARWKGKRGLLNQRVCRIKFSSNNYSEKFMFSCLQPYLDAIHSETSAVTVKHLSSKTIKSIPLPLPPLPIQRAIVGKIEELFSSLDSSIADLKKAQEQLKVYRQAVLKKAFEGNWQQEKLEKVSDAMGGFAFKSGDFLSEGVYQVVRIGNVRPGKIKKKTSPVFLNEIDEKIKKKYLLQPNDVVITLTGTRKKRDYGYTALIKETNLLLNQRLAYIRLKEDLLPKFFLYFSWSEPFKVQFFGSETGNVGQGNVGMKSVRETLVPKPSIDEQNKIIKYLEKQFSICDQIETDIKASLNSSQTLRQSILKKAFEGNLLSEEEIEKCKKEHDYEPADVLLKKIKAEKNKK